MDLAASAHCSVSSGFKGISLCLCLQDGRKDEREVDNSDDAASANQKRMNADPLEMMLMNMGYRITSVLEREDEEGAREGGRGDQGGDNPVQCRPSWMETLPIQYMTETACWPIGNNLSDWEFVARSLVKLFCEMRAVSLWKLLHVPSFYPLCWHWCCFSWTESLICVTLYSDYWVMMTICCILGSTSLSLIGDISPSVPLNDKPYLSIPLEGFPFFDKYCCFRSPPL